MSKKTGIQLVIEAVKDFDDPGDGPAFEAVVYHLTLAPGVNKPGLPQPRQC